MCQMFKFVRVSNVRFQFAVNFYRMQKIETNYKDDIFRSKTFQLKFLLLQRKKYLKFHSCTERKKDKIFLLLPYYNEYIMFTSPFISNCFRLKLYLTELSLSENKKNLTHRYTRGDGDRMFPLKRLQKIGS